MPVQDFADVCGEDDHVGSASGHLSWVSRKRSWFVSDARKGMGGSLLFFHERVAIKVKEVWAVALA